MSPYSGMGPVRAVKATESPFVPEPRRPRAVRADKLPVFPSGSGKGKPGAEPAGRKAEELSFH